MATGTILLPILGAVGDATNPPGVGFGGTVGRPYLIFDGTATIEACHWTFRMPENFDPASAPVAKIQWSGSTANTLVVQWTGYVMALTADVDGAADTDSYDTENVVTDANLGTTAKRIQEASLTLTNADSVAAGDYVSFRLLRDYDDTADTLTEDALLWALSLEYTTT